MQFTHIATITTKLAQMPDFLRRAETELLPIYRELPGFVAFTVAKTGEAKAVAFGIWQTREQAEQAIKISDKWMKDEISQLVDESSNRIGALPFFAVTRDLGAYASVVAPVAGVRV
jgi:hypothetical protein